VLTSGVVQPRDQEPRPPSRAWPFGAA
jgi:hypothetical protein